jgi:hypothetical protein
VIPPWKILIRPSGVPMYVTLSAADDTSCCVCGYRYQFPMHGGRGSHLLDVENDDRKSSLTRFTFFVVSACYVRVEDVDI